MEYDLVFLHAGLDECVFLVVVVVLLLAVTAVASTSKSFASSHLLPLSSSVAIYPYSRASQTTVPTTFPRPIPTAPSPIALHFPIESSRNDTRSHKCTMIGGRSWRWGRMRVGVWLEFGERLLCDGTDVAFAHTLPLNFSHLNAGRSPHSRPLTPRSTPHSHVRRSSLCSTQVEVRWKPRAHGD